MPKPPRPWTVTRHDPIEKLEDNLWAVQGDVPGIPFKRRMFIIKRADGTLMFYGMAIPLEDVLRTEAAATGHAGALRALQHAVDRLARRDCELCLVGGVDSYLDVDMLDWMEANDRRRQ